MLAGIAEAGSDRRPHPQIEGVAHDRGPRNSGHRSRPVSGPVVDYEDVGLKVLERTSDDVSDGGLFVERRDDDEQIGQGSLLGTGKSCMDRLALAFIVEDAWPWLAQ